MTDWFRFIIDEPVLEKYFADGPYRFQMQFGRGEFREFYGASPENEEILRERRDWLRQTPERYLAVLAEAEPLIVECCELALEEKTAGGPLPDDALSKARFLGEHWEPDYLLLKPQPGSIRLVGGCVCFPSSWALETKIGRPIAEIHEVVPTLNSAVGRQIEVFLEKLRPGVCWTRSNWGLSRSPERNQHPGRKLPRLDGAVSIDEVFFRIEEQSLTSLRRTGGILFGIRIRTVPLRRFLGDPSAERLRAALETMPESIAEYKGLSPARKHIIELLSGEGKTFANQATP